MNFDFDKIIDRHGTGSNKWSRYPADVLPMWVADMDFAVAPAIAATLCERVKHPVYGYATTQDSLREQIAATIKKRYNWTIHPTDIVLLPGVEPGFNMAMKAFLSPGETIAVQTPIYRPILRAPAHWGMKRRDLWLTPSSNGSWSLPQERLSKQMMGCKAFLLCNPHNPTGKVYSREELSHIATVCEREDATIISDEIHCDLVFDGRTHIPIASLSPEISKRSITLMAASKAYNIAGLKTAFAIITDPECRARFENARLGMVDSVNLFGLVATEAAYSHGQAWLDALRIYLQDNRDFLVRYIQEYIPGITVHSPQSTFLAWLDCSRLKLPSGPQHYFLNTAKVALSDGAEFHETETGQYARLNFGCPRATLATALDRIRQSVNTL
ncbi:aminotransferase [Gluconobacter oxydans]|uniref:MalY/PatB family protein n=1 Tax=Gluconobacter thailandicus TaxID=257438 RepID=UPI00029998FE|nr:PatB family C-S lyase [Gluconobacter thailandicus]AFW00718.1 aminotransferase [Gluconobacter oxydans H24]ANQ40589.1 aminotransferase [Gluconobacter oxydans]